MNIKKTIKELGVRLVDISNELDISRPTLDTYIMLYESGEPLPHDKYQIIFDRLFDDGVSTKEDFLAVLNGYHKLLERDKILGIKNLNVVESDLIGNIVNHIREDIKSEDYDEDIYVFINMMLGSYKKTPTFSRIAKYFLLLNNSKTVEELDAYQDCDKAFYTNLYQVMKLDVEKKNKYESANFQKFRDRILEIQAVTSLKMARKTEAAIEGQFKIAFEEKMNMIINEKIRLGSDIDDIDMKEIIKSIDIKELLEK